MHKTVIVSNYLILKQFGGAKYKWTTLVQHGVLFPPEYIQSFVPLVYNGEKIILDKDAEEIASLYSKYTDTDYVKNKIFRKNFWNDWKQILPKDTIIKSLDECDFSLLYAEVIRRKEEKKLQPKINDEKYKTAIVDGKIEPVGNFRIEPPGIFLGRGCNPKLGKVKRRIYPEDIILNMGKDAPIPEPLPGHHWKKIIHDRTVEWLASWKDDITGKMKYVWLAANSEQKAKSDMEKYDLAKKLKSKIKNIHRENEITMQSDDPYKRQIGTALYFIDNFALRAGNEKGEDETDTVGVCSLRIEHVKMLPNDKIKLDFLGKDSVRFNKELHVTPLVYKNIMEFIKDKTPKDQLFDLINPTDVNKYLQTFMKKLTGKVFRTYNASNLFQKELKKITKKFDNYNESDKINLLLTEFNRANAKVAELCNHQKNITKSTNDQINKLKDLINESKLKLKKIPKIPKNKSKILKMKNVIKKMQAKRNIKIELKNIALGTSKINYIDPRITFAFLKKHNIPYDKIFSKTLIEKFKWAESVNDNYKF